MKARFDALGIVVSDMEAALAFYRLLGLEFDEDPETPGHVEADLPGGTRLMLDTEQVITSFDPDFEPPTGSGRIGLAFVCDQPADVDRLHDEVVDAGHASSRSPFDAFWGQRYATVLDPDGNAIDLFAPLNS
ncbi:MAG: VOC family protein [Acidimicrobiia bacterium]|nr:MAG: VOC family protein [Acidimicrobiia bacterium]